MKILGVCGGIGSGKSTACKLMVDALGCVGRIGELCLSKFLRFALVALFGAHFGKLPSHICIMHI